MQWTPPTASRAVPFQTTRQVSPQWAWPQQLPANGYPAASSLAFVGVASPRYATPLTSPRTITNAVVPAFALSAQQAPSTTCVVDSTNYVHCKPPQTIAPWAKAMPSGVSKSRASPTCLQKSVMLSDARKVSPPRILERSCDSDAARNVPALRLPKRVNFDIPDTLESSPPLPSLLATMSGRAAALPASSVDNCSSPYADNSFFGNVPHKLDSLRHHVVRDEERDDDTTRSPLETEEIHESLSTKSSPVLIPRSPQCAGCELQLDLEHRVFQHHQQQTTGCQSPRQGRQAPVLKRGRTQELTVTETTPNLSSSRAKSQTSPRAKSQSTPRAKSQTAPRAKSQSTPRAKSQTAPKLNHSSTNGKSVASTLGLNSSPKKQQLAGAIRDALASEAKARRYAAECFVAFDHDCNKKLSFEELRECMKHINLNLGIEEFRERDVEYYMRRFDTDCDNELNCFEFEEVYRYLLLMKLNEEEPIPFCRQMFLGRRRGRPSQHYEVVESLGKGSYGVVEKVCCKTTNSLRVMKTIHKRKAEKNGLPTKLVMEEISKLKSLDHPAVLRLFEYFVDTEALYLITDLLPCGDLGQILERSQIMKKALAETWVRIVFRQVCEGVGYIHGKGVMHKDLKLDNIMLNSLHPPEAVIIDVGLAEIFPPEKADQFHSREVAGTLATMAPEVIARKFTYKCDVWSLGCCFYALNVKKPIWYKHSDGSDELYPYPFRAPDDDSGQELEAYVMRQLKGPDMSRTTCDKDARNLARSMLSSSDRARPNIQQVLQHRWFQQRGDSGNDDTPNYILAPVHLDCLINFNRANALEEAILLDVASQLPLGELRELRALFEKMDKDGDGKLDDKELAEGMQQAGLEAPLAEQAAQRFAHGGSVEFSRFIAALVPSCRDLLALYLRDAFNRLDADGDGLITMAELQQLFEHGKLKHLKATRAAISILEALGCSSSTVRTPISFERLNKYFMELCV